MEVTDADEFTVGSIAWVRRRNGSWWPGKIVGPEELSSSHLTSPRSGTPVKLLGREDASVDWYNLEKSKRVKPFRCGEFDDCIHKAESGQGMPPKKREKYARREDAILHALELERELLKNKEKLALNVVKKDVGMPSGSLGKEYSEPGCSKLNQIYKGKYLSHRNDMVGIPMSSQRYKEGNHLSGEDDHIDVTPHMRGLQDFGGKVASKRKFSSSSSLNGFWKPTIDGRVEAFAHGGHAGGTSHMNRVEQTAICRAKRSKCVYLPADSLEYETAPLGHTDLSAPPIGTRLHRETLIDDTTSRFAEQEPDSSETDFPIPGPGSDSSETEPDDELPSFSDLEVGRYEAHDRRSLVDVDPDESAHSGQSGDMPHLYNQYPYFAREAVSKWQLKGKRNTRNVSKRPLDTTDGRGYCFGPYYEEKAAMTGLDNGHSLSSAVSMSRNRVGQNINDWEDGTWEDRSAWDECWDIKKERYDQIYDDIYTHRRRPKHLIDVDLKVQGSYQKAPVPIVSLMSKLNGKAIIGHPIQVEALEDGLSNTLFSPFDDSGDNDGGTTIPHAWRTARRTANVRVPRPHLFSTLDGDEAADELLSSDEDRPQYMNSHKPSQVKKNPSHNSRLPSDRKLSKKASKKVSLSSSLKTKTRTLSSLAIEQRFGNKGMIQHGSGQRDRLMKPESSSGSLPTTVACIPVKLVFSRLLEKINRPASKATTASVSNAVLLNGDAEKS